MMLETFCGDEHFDDYPPYAKVDVTPKLINRVMELKVALESVGADRIIEYDYRVEYCDTEGNEDDCAGEFQTEGHQMHVYQHGAVRWEDYVKHTNILIYTQEISFIELNEIKKVYDTPAKELPLLISNLKSEEAKRVLNERMQA